MDPSPPELPGPDRLLHEPGRHLVCLALCRSAGRSTFSGLRAATALSDGNLHRHLAALAAAGVVDLRGNGAQGRASRTSVTLTPAGRERLAAYAAQLLASVAVLRAAAPEARGEGSLDNHLL